MAKFLGEDALNQLVSLIFTKIATDNSALIETDIAGAANNLKAAGAKAVKDYVTSALGELAGINLNFTVVESLPTADISASTIYLLPKSETADTDGFDEYIYLDGDWEKLGTTTIDLSGYWQKTELSEMTASDVNTSWNNVAGA